MFRSSVIIPAFNNADTIGNLVESLTNQTMEADEFEVIVVDDASTDGTVELLEELDFDGKLTILKQIENRGAGAARNRGIETAESEVLLFIDADMTVEKDWVRAHTVPIEEGRWDGAIGLVDHAEAGGDAFLEYLDRPGRAAKALGADEQISHSYFLFGNAALRRKMIDDVVGFDENISAYGGEELDLIMRIEEKTNPVLRYNPTAKSVHHHKRNLLDTCAVLENFGREVVPYLIEKHPSLKSEFKIDLLEAGGLKGATFRMIVGGFFFSAVKSFYTYLPKKFTYLAIRYLLGRSVMAGYLTRESD